MDNQYAFLANKDDQKSDDKFYTLQPSEDSSRLIIIEKNLMEACHELGLLTPIKSERQNLLERLKELLEGISDENRGRLQEFIDDLEEMH